MYTTRPGCFLIRSGIYRAGGPGLNSLMGESGHPKAWFGLEGYDELHVGCVCVCACVVMDMWAVSLK